MMNLAVDVSTYWDALSYTGPAPSRSQDLLRDGYDRHGFAPFNRLLYGYFAAEAIERQLRAQARAGRVALQPIAPEERYPMAAVWSLDGYLAADDMTDDDACRLAERLADEWDEPVELELAAGVWHVYPTAYADGTRPPAELMTAYNDEGDRDAH